MTTEELLWNATFEYTTRSKDEAYNYQEEWLMENYYNKEIELSERLSKRLKSSI